MEENFPGKGKQFCIVMQFNPPAFVTKKQKPVVRTNSALRENVCGRQVQTLIKIYLPKILIKPRKLNRGQRFEVAVLK